MYDVAGTLRTGLGELLSLTPNVVFLIHFVKRSG